jgi:fatty acid desaturase
MTEVNDPLVNSISLRVPRIIDTLHLNFSYHTEHHIFPGMNPDYYPLVQKHLLQLYPERLNLLSAREAWRLLMQTPRHYLDATTFSSSSGAIAEPCPLSKPTSAST